MVNSGTKVRRLEQSRWFWPAIGLAWLIILHLTLRSPGAQQFLAALLGAPRVGSHNPANDPPLGAVIYLPVRDLYGKRLDLGREKKRGTIPSLLVYAGTCSECSLRAFNPMSIEADSYYRTIVLYDSGAADIPGYFRRLPHNFLIISDPSGKYSQMLNPAWSPRFYLLDSDNCLQGIQSQALVNPPFLYMPEEAQ